MKSLPLPLRICLRADLYPRVYLPDFTTRASLAAIDSVDLAALDFLVGAIAICRAEGQAYLLIVGEQSSRSFPKFGPLSCIAPRDRVKTPRRPLMDILPEFDPKRCCPFMPVQSQYLIDDHCARTYRRRGQDAQCNRSAPDYHVALQATIKCSDRSHCIYNFILYIYLIANEALFRVVCSIVPGLRS